MYNEMINQLETNTDKIKNNLKKYNHKDELIVLIEIGSLVLPHKMYIGLMEIVKKYIEDNNSIKMVVGGYLISSSNGYIRHKLKNDFICLNHRVNMTKLYTKNSDWLECLDWGFKVENKLKFFFQKIINKRFSNYKNIKMYSCFWN